MSSDTFQDLGLAPGLLQAVASRGFTVPSPIQAKAIPPALAGRDIVGQSQTGSGKTLAFALPAMQKVDTSIHAVQVLVLCPTRELAMQVCRETADLLPAMPGISAVPVYGGASYGVQLKALRQGAQVVVGTPGRVLDLASRGDMPLDRLKVLVFDEADEMLNMGFQEDIDSLMAQVPATRQTFCFSATMSPAIRRLIANHTQDPEVVTIEAAARTVDSIKQWYHEARPHSKLEVMCRVLDMERPKLAIVFANTKRMVDEITDKLMAANYNADRLHGDLSQDARDRVMRHFREGNLTLLAATDVAARGLHVDDVDLVINYDLPMDPEDYVHRIGRTGRAGRSGKAVSLIHARDMRFLPKLERFVRHAIERRHIPTPAEIQRSRIAHAIEMLRETLELAPESDPNPALDPLLEAGYSERRLADALFGIWTHQHARDVENLPEDREALHPRRAERSARPDRPPRPDRPAWGERPPRDDQARPFNPSERPEKPAWKERPPREDRGPSDAGSFRQREDRPQQDRRRPQEGGRTRLFINVGSMDGVRPGEIAGAIYNTSSVPSGAVGSIDIFEKSSYVDVASEHVDRVLTAIDGASLRGRKLRMDHAGEQKPRGFGGGYGGGRGGEGGYPSGRGGEGGGYSKPHGKYGGPGGGPRFSPRGKGGKPGPGGKPGFRPRSKPKFFQ